jgi:uncharacterized phage protein gp47/JayE
MATAPTIDEYGISAPQYGEILDYLRTQYRSIFGDDVYLESDSQDGQFLAIIAAAINDSNAAAVAIYNSFSPSTAQGNGLSSNVKINGIARLVASKSTVNVAVGGVAGTTITNGVVSDGTNNFNLPASVTIPSSGEITVTATAQEDGAIEAAANTITSITTPVYNWQTVNNPTAASAGNPVETDAALRNRQSNSVALPSLSAFGGIIGAVKSVSAVSSVKAYENDTDTTDINGLPPHSVGLVVRGGDATAIATAIAAKKTPGVYTHGTTAVYVPDSFGIPRTIRFSTPVLVPIAVTVSLHTLTGYTTAISEAIKTALVDYVAGLEIGQTVIITRLYVPAQLAGATSSTTFEVVSVLAAVKPGVVGSADFAMTFDGLATLDIADVTISVV